MNIIKKITISKFRSIGAKEVIEASHFNVISGGNDSGKSNYLKALNLFFNGETDFGKRYNSQDDFNKWFRDNGESGTRDIEIEIEFAKGSYNDTRGINDGFVVKKTFDNDGGTKTEFFLPKNGEKTSDKNKIADSDLSYKRANAVVSEDIKFIYIPAIRDYNFQTKIREQLLEIVNSKDGRHKSTKLKEAFSLVEKELLHKDKDNKITGELSQLIKDVKKHLEEMEIRPVVNFAALLASTDFETTGQIKTKAKRAKEPKDQPVKLRHRGDGVQMHFLSMLLSFIAEQDTKHFYIWGYEEPEIALELKRQFEFAELFAKNFCNKTQIFITTHSPAFIFNEDRQNKTVYRVRFEQDGKKERKISKISPIENYQKNLFDRFESETNKSEKELLEREIWGVNHGKISAALGSTLEDIIGHRHISNSELEIFKDKLAEAVKENINLKKIEDSLRGQINNIKLDLAKSRPPKLFICEDKNMVKTWENLFEKAGIKGVIVKTSEGKDKDCFEAALSWERNLFVNYNPMIFRQFDRDGLTEEQVNALESLIFQKFNKLHNYKAKFLPVCEVENFLVLAKQEKGLSFNWNEVQRDSLDDEMRGKITGALDLGKRFAKGQENAFKIFNSADQKMIETARKDKQRFFPGKVILNFLDTKLRAENLKNYSYEEFPALLKEYLSEIKNFFDKNESGSPSPT